MSSASDDLRISELSKASGIPLATVKYYLREGLLPAGKRVAANQARYGLRHLERLEAIRAMREIAQLPIAVIREVVGLIDDPGIPFDALIERVSDLLVPGDRLAKPGSALPVGEVDAMLSRAGLPVGEDSAIRGALADTLAALRAHYRPELPAEALLPYADAVREMARAEIDTFFAEGVRESRDRAVSRAIVGIVLWQRVLILMRRAAQKAAFIEHG